MGLASVSVDLDSLVHYCRIHGVPEAELGEHGAAAAYTVAVPRLLELFARAKVPVTLFAVGDDLAHPACAAELRRAAAAGAEIGNHSQTHDYALSRRPPAAIREDVERGARSIEAVVGERPAGFRAPGYTLSAALYQAVCDTGHRYDSSVFPAVPYYAAKAAVMGALAVLRRPSRAILDSPRVLAAPRAPYFPAPGRPYARGDGPVLELPVGTTPYLRFPLIGTFVVSLPRPLLRAAYRSIRGEAFFNLELHAIDVLDEADGIPPGVVRQQPDARTPHGEKLARLAEVLEWLRGDFDLTTLGEAARRLAPQARAV